MRIEASMYRNTASLLGFHPTKGRYGLLVYTYLAVLLLMLVGSIYHQTFTWEDLDERVNSIKTMFYVFTSLYAILLLMYRWTTTMNMVVVLEEGVRRFPFAYTRRREDMERRVNDEITTVNTLWYYVINGYILSSAALLIAMTVTSIFSQKSDEIDVKRLYSMLSIYYPEAYESVATYVLGTFAQLLVITYAPKTAYLIVTASLNSMQLVAGELKLLTLSLEEMDLVVEGIRGAGQSQVNVEKALKQFIQYFVQQHQTIYRRMDTVYNGFKSFIFVVNGGIGAFLCLIIYIIAQTEDITSKTAEIVLCITLAFEVFCYDIMGELVSLEDENLRHALYQSSWMDKPQWFKKAMLILMIRCNKSIELKPAGMFTLNRRNLTLTLKATYSYYSILRNLKK